MHAESYEVIDFFAHCGPMMSNISVVVNFILVLIFFKLVLKRIQKRLKVLDDVSVTFSRSKRLKTNKSRRK